jgi:hypothetical protein
VPSGFPSAKKFDREGFVKIVASAATTGRLAPAVDARIFRHRPLGAFGEITLSRRRALLAR